MANNWRGWRDVQWQCRQAAEKRARYATEWSWTPFKTFSRGDDYPKTGRVVAIDSDVKFQNGFGAMERVRLTCLHDLRSGETVRIDIEPQ